MNIQAESPDPTSTWRSLIPVIKVNISTVSVSETQLGSVGSGEGRKWRSMLNIFYAFFIYFFISKGRLAFGNHHLPQTLCVNFDDAILTYATKPPSCHLDQFMHIVKGSLENVRVMLVPSPRYLGLQNDEWVQVARISVI